LRRGKNVVIDPLLVLVVVLLSMVKDVAKEVTVVVAVPVGAVVDPLLVNKCLTHLQCWSGCLGW
jgi:hypothetical protein